MALGTEETVGLLAVHRGAVEQAQHTTHLVVEFLRGVTPFADSLLVGCCQMVAVVGIGSTHGQSVSPRAKLQVQSVADGLVSVVTATPV